jgi:hypothetical protein
VLLEGEHPRRLQNVQKKKQKQKNRKDNNNSNNGNDNISLHATTNKAISNMVVDNFFDYADISFSSFGFSSFI